MRESSSLPRTVLMWGPFATATFPFSSDTTTTRDFDNVYPTLTAYVGCPQLKTQKLLSGCALVADSFSREDGIDPDEKGMGRYAHEDGYNVLYGDWHAKWLLDGPERILRWSYSDTTDDASVSASIASIYNEADDGTTYKAEGFLIWNYFDIEEDYDNR